MVVATERGSRDACRELVEAFLPAIGAVARRVHSAGRVQHNELMQAGIAGLLLAARRYDPRTQTPFWGYASFWVRKAMQELVAELARPAALSDHAVRGLARVNAVRREHLQAHGVEPTSEELAAATGFTRRQLDSLLAIDRTPRSFEAPRGTGESTAATLAEIVADPSAETEYEQVLDRLEIESVRNLARRLDDRERTVLLGHYGLGQAPRTLHEIGTDLGVTAERARQIEARALAKLRAATLERPDVGGGPT